MILTGLKRNNDKLNNIYSLSQYKCCQFNYTNPGIVFTPIIIDDWTHCINGWCSASDNCCICFYIEYNIETQYITIY